MGLELLHNFGEDLEEVIPEYIVSDMQNVSAFFLKGRRQRRRGRKRRRRRRRRRRKTFFSSPQLNQQSLVSLAECTTLCNLHRDNSIAGPHACILRVGLLIRVQTQGRHS